MCLPHLWYCSMVYSNKGLKHHSKWSLICVKKVVSLILFNIHIQTYFISFLFLHLPPRFTTHGTKWLQNSYKLVNLGALKFSTLYENYIFHCMSNIFCVEFQRYPLKFHTKYLTHTLKDMQFVEN